MLDNGKHSRANEKFVLKLRDHVILEALAAGKHVIVDDTNLHPKHEQHIRDLVKGLAQVKIVDFMHVDVETCIQRDLIRPNSVGSRVIRQMWQQYLQWYPRKLEQNESLPAAILCDLDGTLAIIHDRSPYDASKSDGDLLNEPVAAIVRQFQASGHAILFLTGREDQHRAPTVRFLEQHLGPEFPYELHMRATSDRRKDAVVKQEMLEREVLPRFRVSFVLDDRNQVVDMWRGLGLTCLQVNYGDF